MDILNSLLSAVFSLSSRRIGLYVPDVTISEKHTDQLEITEHPVEQVTSSGTGTVSDHAYRKPSEVVMEVGFASGGSLLDLLDTSSIGISLGISPKEVYEQLIALQRSRVPFTVSTGKRVYSNMLMKSLDITTDMDSENVLMCQITLRELIFTRTSTTTVAADKSNMTQGTSTSAVQSSGVKSVTTPSQSLLSKAYSAISS